MDDQEWYTKRKWDLWVHEITEELDAKMRGNYPNLRGRDIRPVPLEMLMEAWRDLPPDKQSFFTRQLREIWREVAG